LLERKAGKRSDVQGPPGCEASEQNPDTELTGRSKMRSGHSTPIISAVVGTAARLLDGRRREAAATRP
jgi:hypothetical protein